MLIKYALVVKTSKDSWHMMDSDLGKVKDVWELNKDYYRIEKWGYHDTLDGHVLQSREIVNVN